MTTRQEAMRFAERLFDTFSDFPQRPGTQEAYAAMLAELPDAGLVADVIGEECRNAGRMPRPRDLRVAYFARVGMSPDAMGRLSDEQVTANRAAGLMVLQARRTVLH